MKSQLEESIYRELFLHDSFPSAVIAHATGVIDEVNRAFEELTSVAAIELQGRVFHEVLEETVPWTRSESGPFHGFEGIEFGPWRLVRLRRADAEEHERRKEKLNSMAVLAAGMAHDFNNALMAALPWADLLRRRHGEDAGIQEATDHIRKAIFRGRDITQRLLDFGEPAVPKRVRRDLVSLVRDQTALASSVDDGRISFTFDSPAGVILTEVDSVQMASVVQHLLQNAREAIVGEGRIRVRVSRLEAFRRGENSLPEDRDFAEVEVTDSGVGIPTESIKHVFDPFFSTKETQHSSGLGLSVTLRIIDQHGGAVRISSTQSVGTTVRVYLPVIAAGKPVDRVQCPHLLVVDDESTIAEGIKASLELSGVTVTTAGSGEEALQWISSGLVPDGIVLDMGLPGLKGDEVHARIRATLPSVPIIISSGWTASLHVTGLLADGHTGLMQKPYDPEDLLVEFKRLL